MEEEKSTLLTLNWKADEASIDGQGIVPFFSLSFLRSPEFFYFRQLNGRRRLLLRVRARSEPVSECAGF